MQMNENTVPPVSTEDERCAFASVVDVLRYLRGPSGCSWDRKQTLESIRAHMLEESAELIEAIHHHEDVTQAGAYRKAQTTTEQTTTEKQEALEHARSHLREEFGDVLLVWTMMMIIYEEEEEGALTTTLRELQEKLIRRHPHVFLKNEHDAHEKNDAELSKQWDAIKAQQEGKEQTHVSFENFHPALDVLERTKKFQKHKAKHASPPTPNTEIPHTIADIHAELSKLESTSTNAEQGIAKILYHVVELSRACKVSPTAALMRYNATQTV